MIARNLSQRLKRLEDRITPAAQHMPRQPTLSHAAEIATVMFP
jgi:hypothetical protein